MRAMLDDVYIRPVEGTRKVFVLDNVQDMLAPAQNKLLKVLEEPPENVCFVLGATSEFPVLTTVKSRTKRLDLGGFTEEETERYLREKYPHRTDAKEIAAVSGGILSKADELAQAADETGQEAARLLSVLSPAAVPAEARKVTDRQQAGRLLAGDAADSAGCARSQNGRRGAAHGDGRAAPCEDRGPLQRGGTRPRAGKNYADGKIFEVQRQRFHESGRVVCRHFGGTMKVIGVKFKDGGKIYYSRRGKTKNTRKACRSSWRRARARNLRTLRFRRRKWRIRK